MSCEAPAIRVNGVSKAYPVYSRREDRLKQMLFGWAKRYYTPFYALDDLSLDIGKGESFGIIGRNGSGKSTLLQIIAGTLAPTKGNVEVQGRVAALLELGAGFNPEFTGRENVFLNAAILGLTREETEARFLDIAAFADIGEFLELPVKQYSSGMFMRLAFAVQANVDADVLIVDEALAVGDLPFQLKCFAHFRKLKEQGVSIVFVSHDIATVRSFCDRVLYLRGGKCAALGSSLESTRVYEDEIFRDKAVQQSVRAIGAGRTVQSSDGQLDSKTKGIVDRLIDFSDRFQVLAQAHPRLGTGRARITSFFVVDNEGFPLETIHPEQRIRACFLINAMSDLSNDVHLSINIHDKSGRAIMTLRDSAFECQIVAKAGDSYAGMMEFSLPLAAGEYYAKLAILILPPHEKYAGESFQWDRAEIADMIEYGAIFRMATHRRHPIISPVLMESKLDLIKMPNPVALSSDAE